MSQAVEADDREEEMRPETDADAAVSIITNGDPIRSFAQLVEPIADECRLRFDDDGMHVTTVDPANVAMLDLTAHATGFEKFQVSKPHTFGLDLSYFQDAVGWARKRSGDGDPVSIDVFTDPARMRVQVTRPDQQMKRISEWHGIDPEAIRAEPDVLELDLPERATPGVKPLKDGVESLKSYDHAQVTRDGATLVIESEGDSRHDSVYFPNAAWSESDDDEETASTLFSWDYLKDIAHGLDKSKADRVTVKWGDELPAGFEFDHGQWGFEGSYLLAPRIQKDE